MASVFSYPDETRILKLWKVVCTTDGSGDATGTSKKMLGFIKHIYVVPGAAVSNNFTMKIIREDGKDILDSDGNTGQVFADATLSQQFNPSLPVASTLVCTVAAGGNAKVVTAYIYWMEA